MALKNKSTLRTSYGSASGEFAVNANGDIEGTNLQNLSNDLIDSTPVIGISNITELKAILTVDLSAGMMALFVNTGEARAMIYQLKAGTTAESSPRFIRPDDYAASTNEKFWELAKTPVVNQSSTAPTVSNDDSEGYEPGDIWIDNSSGIDRSYTCQDNSTGAAVWAPIHRVFQIAAPPTSNEGESNGYLVGDRWIDTSASPKVIYTCLDNTNTSAVWQSGANDPIEQVVNITGGSDSLTINPLTDVVKINLRTNWDTPTITGFTENKAVLFKFVQDYTGAGSTPAWPFQFTAPSNVSLNDGVNVLLSSSDDGVFDALLFIGLAADKAQQLGGVSIGTTNQL